jgi:hypothetical protein
MATEAFLRVEPVFNALMRPFRMRRMRLFLATFNVTPTTKIIDVGGTAFNWSLIPAPCALTIVNLYGEDRVEGNITYAGGDGRALRYADRSFDIAYSNSVIEHVGEWDDQMTFAREISRVADGYFIQTPNKYFFFDPHLLMPFTHFLPRRVQRAMVRNFTVIGWIVRPKPDVADFLANMTRPLSYRDMRRLFPDAELHRERFLGMTKSIVAIRGSAAVAPEVHGTPDRNLRREVAQETRT